MHLPLVYPRFHSTEADIIISTPLRLVTSLKAGALDLKKYVSFGFGERRGLTFLSVRHLILDEADRMLDTEFLSQIQEIVAACTHPNVQKAVFSATLPAGAEKLAMEMLKDPIRIVVGLKYVPLCTLLEHFSDPTQRYPFAPHPTESDLCC